MGLITKIAWRNILRHKGKSIIIGIILVLGSFILTVGNGVVSGMDHGIEKNIIDGFMGDIVVIPEKEKSDNVYFKMMGESINPINNYKDIKKVLESEKKIKASLPMGKNTVMSLSDEEGEPGYAFVLGVDFAKYQEFFPGSVTPIEGKLLDTGTPGLMMTRHTREEIYDQMHIWHVPQGGKPDPKYFTDAAKEDKNLPTKDEVIFMGMSQNNSTSDIRLPVTGIIRYGALNTFWGHFSIMDIESYRQCLGYFSADDANVKISAEKTKLLSLDTENIDDLFGSGSLVVGDTGNSSIANISFKSTGTDLGTGVDLEKGTYNLICVKLNDSSQGEKVIESLNKTFKEKKLGVRAVSWKKASGIVGSLTTIIEISLFLFVSILFFVAIIVIVNTLSMAALERTNEIGMMRAVGAHKSFIALMFTGETAMLSFVFGGIGMILGIITIKVIPLLHITSENDMLQLVFGGDTFHPYLSVSGIVLVIIQLTIVTIITVIYPAWVANRITPLDAIARD